MLTQCTLEAVFHICLQFMSRWYGYHRLSFLVEAGVERWNVQGIFLERCSCSLSCWNVPLKVTLSLYMRWFFSTSCHSAVQINDGFSLPTASTGDIGWHMVLQPHFDLLHGFTGAGRHLRFTTVVHFKSTARCVYYEGARGNKLRLKWALLYRLQHCPNKTWVVWMQVQPISRISAFIRSKYMDQKDKPKALIKGIWRLCFKEYFN